jgi:hypothetical protein
MASRLNTENLTYKVIGALVTGAIIYFDPVTMVAPPGKISEAVQAAVAGGVVGLKAAGFELSTTWMLRLATSTTLGMLAGSLLAGENMYYMPAIGGAAGFLGCTVWPDKHPLFA